MLKEIIMNFLRLESNNFINIEIEKKIWIKINLKEFIGKINACYKDSE